jgi:cytoskeletal protein RodZ
MDVAEPVPASTEVQRELRRDKTRQTQMMIAIVLFLVVIVLAGVLIWVLQRNAGAPAEEETEPVSVIERAAPHFVAAASEELSMVHRKFEDEQL